VIRTPIALASLAFAALPLLGAAGAGGLQGSVPRPTEPPTIAQLLDRAHAQRWDTLRVGESIVRFGRALEGAPYLEHSLEGPGPEVCRVTTQGFDCVTFMETSLDLARTIRAGHGGGRPTPEDLQEAVTHTRYRAGHLSGYVSRLHYTSDWIADNVAKNVVEDVTPSLGGVRLPVEVGFMSTHPDKYPALAADSALVDSMRRIERRINVTPRTFVPKARVAAIESRLESGDLVAITTSIPGLDYSHTGLIVRDAGGARFMHASSARGKVVIDTTLSAYLARGPKSNTGITVLRAVDPRGRPVHPGR
jgi:hypothetical protein